MYGDKFRITQVLIIYPLLIDAVYENVNENTCEIDIDYSVPQGSVAVLCSSLYCIFQYFI